MRGTLTSPVSHRATVTRVTPSRSANAAWVSPSVPRMRRVSSRVTAHCYTVIHRQCNPRLAALLDVRRHVSGAEHPVAASLVGRDPFGSAQEADGAQRNVEHGRCLFLGEVLLAFGWRYPRRLGCRPADHARCRLHRERRELGDQGGQGTRRQLVRRLLEPREQAGEFGGLGWPAKIPSAALIPRTKASALESTTPAVIVTDAALSKAQAWRLAVMAQTGMARAIYPVHTPLDGDIVFAAATGRKPLNDPFIAVSELGAIAANTLARAIARAVFAAGPLPFPGTLPSWPDKFGGLNRSA